MAKNKGLYYRVYRIEKTLVHHVIEWSATVLSLLGALLVAFKFWQGYPVWVVANALWVSFAWKHKHYGLLFLSVSYLVINFIGLIRWFN